MGIITRNYDFENGDTADADQVDAEFNTIYNEFNGNIDGANIKSTIAGVKTFSDGIKTDTINENTANAGTTFKKIVQTINTAEDGETVTFDLAKGGIQRVTLGGNRTLALSNVSVGQCFVIDLIQDGTGSRTVTWFDTIKWQDGTTPTLSTGAGKIDSFGFICVSSGNYQGYIVGQNL